MKQRKRSEKVCFFIMSGLVVQISLMLLIRMNLLITSQEQESQRCNKTPPISQSLIQSIQGGPIICDRSHENYDWCLVNRPTLLDPIKTTFFTIESHSQATTKPPIIEKVRPYPRKWENYTMSLISEVTLTTSSIDKPCEIHHNTPALVFSVSGYTGNFFHDFNDGIIPLYITLNTLFPNQDVTLVITNFTNWWYTKYEVLLNELSNQPIIDLVNQTTTHCFPSIAVGLISHGPMTIEPTIISNPRNSFLGFRAFLEASYSKCPMNPPPPLKEGKPRLVLVSREGNVGRVMLNQDEIIQVAKEVGFDVVVFKPTKFTFLCDAYQLINACHAMVGVHGAALTHSVYLRPGSVLFQVVPLANDWLAESYFKNLAKGLGLQYVEYKIRAIESSLVDKYGLNHVIVRNPKSVVRGNWTALDSIYLKGQDVRLDLLRFKYYLISAYSKAKTFMDING